MGWWLVEAQHFGHLDLFVKVAQRLLEYRLSRSLHCGEGSESFSVSNWHRLLNHGVLACRNFIVLPAQKRTFVTDELVSASLTRLLNLCEVLDH